MATNLRKAKKETTKAVPPNGQWQKLPPTELQQTNFERALFRWILDNGGQKAKIKRNNAQAGNILPYLADLSPEWQCIDAKTFRKEDNPQYKALFKVIDKYGKKMPTQEQLDAELKDWKEQKATAAEQAVQSDVSSCIPTEEDKGEHESIQEKPAESTPQTKMYLPPRGIHHTDTPRKAPKPGDKRFHEEVMQSGWDEDEYDRKSIKLWRIAQDDKKAYLEAEKAWQKSMINFKLHMDQVDNTKEAKDKAQE